MLKSNNLIEIIIAAKYLAGKEFKGAEKDIQSLGSAMQKVAKASMIAGAAIGSSLLMIARQTAKYGDEAKKFERGTGIQANTLATLRYAIQRWGGTTRDADTSLRRLTKAVADAAGGLVSYERQFQRLGITTDQLIGPDGSLKSIDNLLPILADGFKNLKDDVMAASVAQILFGRGGLRILPMLKQGSEGLVEFAERAKNLGILFDRDLLESAEDYQDAMLDVREATKGVMFAFGQQLMPAITAGTRIIIKQVIAVKDWVRAHREIVPALVAVTAALLGTGGLIMAITTSIAVIKKIALVLAFPVGPMAALVIGVQALAAALIYLQIKQKMIPSGFEEIEDWIFKNEVAASALKRQIDELTEAEKNNEEQGWQGDKVADTRQKRLADLNILLAKNTKETEGLTKALEDLEKAEYEAGEADMAMAALQKDAAARQKQAIADFKQMRYDMEFDFRLELGLETYPTAIARTRDAIAGLTEEILHQETVVARFTNKAGDLYINSLARLVEMEEELIETKRKLIALQETFADKTEQTADGIKREADETERQRQEIERLKMELEMVENMKDAAQGAIDVLDSIFSSGFQSMFAGVMMQANTFAGMWKKFWIGIGSSVVSILASYAAKAAAIWIVKAFFALPTGGGSFLGAPIGPTLGKGITAAQGGGEIVYGSRGKDNAPMLLGRGENVLDHNTNDRLKAFLGAAEGGAIGSGSEIHLHVGVYTGTDNETMQLGKLVDEAQEQYNEFVAEGPS